MVSLITMHILYPEFLYEWSIIELGMPELQIPVMAATVLIVSLLTVFLLEASSDKIHMIKEHEGISNMVKGTKDKPLSAWLVIKFGYVAFVNAVIEETIFRGIFAYELASTSLYSLGTVILIQSCSFDLPSYGYLMGLLWYISGGKLILPILCHFIADFYLFAVTARKKFAVIRDDPTLEPELKEPAATIKKIHGTDER